MSQDFAPVFAALKAALASEGSRFAVKTDSPHHYELVTRSPSPYPQHKGQPMWFGAVKTGKAYVSYHLMPLYMNAPLTKTIPAALKRHMQGKSCFNFKTPPEPAILDELRELTSRAADAWAKQKFL
jgi:hypothetical protein